MDYRIEEIEIPVWAVCRPLLNVFDVAAIANLPYGRVLTEIRAGRLAAGRIGNQYRIDPVELDRYLTDRGLPGVVTVVEQI